MLISNIILAAQHEKRHWTKGPPVAVQEEIAHRQGQQPPIKIDSLLVESINLGDFNLLNEGWQ